MLENTMQIELEPHKYETLKPQKNEVIPISRRGKRFRILNLLRRIKNLTIYQIPSCFSQGSYRRQSIDPRRSIDFGKMRTSPTEEDMNRLDETDMSLNPCDHLSTKRHKFTSKLPVYLQSNRKKWMVFDQLTNTNVVLHRIGENANRLSEYVEITQEKADQKIVEMTKKQFKEVVLMRCARKCPYTLLCFGYALDRYQNVYISTEYFTNLTLNEYQSQLPDKVLDEITSKSISAQVLRALDYLHAIKIVHGDVVGSNILIKTITDANTDDQHAIDGFHVKLYDFRKSRDAVSSPKDDNAQLICLKCNFSQTKALGTEYDVKCFGLLMFKCLKNVNPWDEECLCDQNFAKRYPDCSMRNGENDNLINNEFNTFERANSITKRLRKSYRHLKMMKSGYLEKTNYDKLDDKNENRTWTEFSPKFTNCLLKILSPYPEDRLSASSLLRGDQYNGLFLPFHDSGIAWKKGSIAEKYPHCV